MIYFLFWYMVLVTTVSTIIRFYHQVKSGKPTGEKVGGCVGIMIRTLLTAFFLYLVYPVLQFV